MFYNTMARTIQAAGKLQQLPRHVLPGATDYAIPRIR